MVLITAAWSVLIGSTAEMGESTSLKMLPRPKPGFVRLINLSSETVSMLDGKRAMVAPVRPHTASSATTFSSGSRNLGLRGGPIDLSVPVHLSPGERKFVVLGASGKTFSTFEDENDKEKGHNISLIYLSESGSRLNSGPMVTVSSGGSHFSLSSQHAVLTLPLGIWNLSGKSLTTSHPFVVRSDIAYTLAIVKKTGGRCSDILLSRLVKEKAVVAGVSRFR